MKVTTLKEIAEIRTGYSFKKSESAQEISDLKGLQISDLRLSKVINPATLHSVNWSGRGSPPVLQSGDVVIAAKGKENYASIFLDGENNVIPSSQLFVMTVKKKEEVFPQFLCWLLNYSETQKKLLDMQVGTSIFSLSKKYLSQLELPIPNIREQEKILFLDNLWEKEKRLRNALLENRESIVSEISKKLLYGE